MKTRLLIAAGLLSTQLVTAQTEGTITYKETVKMQLDLDSNMRAMLGALPSETSVETELLFNTTASLYRNVKKEENTSQQIEEGEGRHIKIEMGTPDEKVYSDIKNNRLIEERDFMGKKFLVDTVLTKQEWKLTGKQKNVLNYPCQQAMKIDKDTVYAWFTPAIPVSTGPMGLRSLPGMVLEMEMNSGMVKIVAQKVDLVAPNAKAMAKPKDGKKVKPSEYKKIVDEKTREMQEAHGGSGNMIIKIEQR